MRPTGSSGGHKICCDRGFPCFDFLPGNHGDSPRSGCCSGARLAVTVNSTRSQRWLAAPRPVTTTVEATVLVFTRPKGSWSTPPVARSWADTRNHTVRSITPDGVVTTFAGVAGLPGAADGPGGEARFRFPAGMAIDAEGNLFVADRGNHSIRKNLADRSRQHSRWPPRRGRLCRGSRRRRPLRFPFRAGGAPGWQSG